MQTKQGQLPGLELAAHIKQESKHLNLFPMLDPIAPLAMWHCDLVGGLLLVTQQFAKDSTFAPPYITVLVAALTLATLGSFLVMDPPSFAYSDFWDDSLLCPYVYDIDDNDHCPLLVATKVKLPSTIEFFTDLQPLFIPFGEQLLARVMTPTGTTTRAFFLPEVCDLLLGLT
jgi:hypothetical protein